MSADLVEELPPFCFRDTSRHGTVRIYYRRRKGDPKIRLLAEPGTPEFHQEYATITGAIAPLPRRDARDTWSWLCEVYYKSVDYLKFDKRTQHVRWKVLSNTQREPVRKGDSATYGAMPVDELTEANIQVLCDRKAIAGALLKAATTSSVTLARSSVGRSRRPMPTLASATPPAIRLAP